MPTWIKEHVRPGVTDDDSRSQAIPLKQVTSAGLLGLLLGVTATAIGLLVSWWLVPPYLLMMVWLLLPEGQVHALRQVIKGGSERPEASPVVAEAPAAPLRTEPAPDLEARGTATSSATAAVALKPKRKRAPRKPRAVAEVVEPVAATWVQVGPGRFVRVEVAEPAAEPAPVAASVEPLDRPSDLDEPRDIAEVVSAGEAEIEAEAVEPEGVLDVDEVVSAGEAEIEAEVVEPEGVLDVVGEVETLADESALSDWGREGESLDATAPVEPSADRWPVDEASRGTPG